MRPDLERGVFVCEYCGGESVPPPEAEGVLVLDESTQECPLCFRRLSDGSLERCPLKYCTACHGMLIPMNQLAELITVLRSRLHNIFGQVGPRSPLDADRHLKCPSCGSEMDGHPYGGGGNVNVDSCEKCGLVWLDGGELRRMASTPDHKPSYYD